MFSAGCLGGQTGGEFGPGEDPPSRPAVPEVPVVGAPDGPNPPEAPPNPQPGIGTDNQGEDAGCTASEQAVALADASRLGFSAADLLDTTLGAHAATLRWNPNTGVVSYGPEQGESSITLTVAYANGGAFFVTSVPPASGAEIGCGAPRLEVDVVVRLESGGGALAEEFPARLRAEVPSTVALSRGLPLEKLSGSFFVTLPRSHTLETLNVGVTFEPSGVRGELSGVVTQTVGSGSDASVGALYVKFAEWP